MFNPAPHVCLVCGSSGEIIEYLETYTDPLQKVTYDLFSCHSCDVWFWNPLKNPGSDWYERDERYAGRNEDPILEPTENHKRTVAFLEGKQGRVLDIGCGVGNFLAHAAKKSWECYGIDFDRDAIEAGKRTFGLQNLEVNDLSGFAEKHPELKFDLITAFDVFEHIDNHQEFIEVIQKLLAPNGYIAMTMPYRKRALWLMPGDLPPRHLTRWDRHALSNFLEKNGFNVRRIERQNEGLRPVLMKLRFKYGSRLSIGLVKSIKDGSRKVADQKPSDMYLLKIKLAKLLARAKDIMLFGLPALCIWLWMLPGSKRYITLFVIAQKS